MVDDSDGITKGNEVKDNQHQTAEKELRVKRMEEYKRRAVTAVEQGKIFRIISAYDVPRVKYELIKRGYVESISHSWNDEYLRLSDVVLLQEATDGNMYEQALLSRLIGGNSAKYMWITASQLYDQYQSVPFLSKINIRNHNFGTKDELHFYVRQINSGCTNQSTTCYDSGWIDGGGIRKDGAGIFHPRSYAINDERTLLAFENDFRVTLATSLVIHLNDLPTDAWLSSEHGSLDLKILDYAMALVLRYINWIKNETVRVEVIERAKLSSQKVGPAATATTTDNSVETDINGNDITNGNVIERSTIDEHRYVQLNAAHRAVIELGQSFRPVKQSELNEHYIYRLKFLAEQVLEMWPSRRYDGTRNVWLLKPTNSSQGQGIIVTDNEKCIRSHLHNLKKKFVVQKYIERPLLMYDTKFDIRQYFLITVDDVFVRVWSSPVSSIKFASNEFTLEDLDESIHITNAYVQQKYRTQPRPKPIPPHRMWSWLEFIDYLDSIGADFAWNKIYTSMKRQITSIAAASFDNIEKKAGRFELFGVDWLVTYDFQTFLLEIQRPPGMGTYSNVSTLVCGTILEDVVRVTVDYAADPSASTGSFELIYQRAIQMDNNDGDDAATKNTTTTPTTAAVIDLNSMPANEDNARTDGNDSSNGLRLTDKEANGEMKNGVEEKVGKDDEFTSVKVKKNVVDVKTAPVVAGALETSGLLSKELNDASSEKLSTSSVVSSSVMSVSGEPRRQEEMIANDEVNAKKNFVGTVEVECY